MGVYYLDDQENIVSSDKATNVVVQQYDEDGKLIGESFGRTTFQADGKMQVPDEPSDAVRTAIENYTDGEGKYMFRKK